jgi:hypothetical protein
MRGRRPGKTALTREFPGAEAAPPQSAALEKDTTRPKNKKNSADPAIRQKQSPFLGKNLDDRRVSREKIAR